MVTGLNYSVNDKLRSGGANMLAQQLRRGVISGLATSESSPQAMSVDISAGSMYFGREASAVSASSDLAISASDPTDYRIDLVVVSTAGVISVVTGTPDVASAVTTPSFDIETQLPIARVDVSPGVSVITDSDIKDLRAYNEVARGGFDPDPAFIGTETEQLNISVTSTSSSTSFSGGDVKAALIKNVGTASVTIAQGATATDNDYKLLAGDMTVWSDALGFDDIAAKTASGTATLRVIGIR